ncbi:MAG: hypothetical protein FWC74_09415, partial [Candidatus Bathyarchaeota archaeon]|nr:hypothetical protein [Candidatus Termitimicrobium sp.]
MKTKTYLNIVSVLLIFALIVSCLAAAPLTVIAADGNNGNGNGNGNNDNGNGNNGNGNGNNGNNGNGNGNNGNNGNGNNGNNGNGNNGNGNGNNGNNGNNNVVQTIYLKGTGSDFTEKWKNVFYVGDSKDASNPSVWHLVCSANSFSSVTEMQITFTNGVVFKWTPNMGPSTNNAGNNPGWVIVAPAGWEIAYVNNGNNNKSESFLKTTATGNIQFNISGFHKGTPDTERKFSISKTVNGMPFIEWSTTYSGNLAVLLKDITFNIYEDKIGAQTRDTRKLVAVGEFDLSLGSTIHFNPVSGKTFDNIGGLYWVVEVLGPVAKTVFTDLGPVPVYISQNGIASIGNTFDYNAKYTIVNGYSSNYIKTLNYPGLNNNGDLFYIGVTNTNTGKEYPSFCANAKSQRFAGDNDLDCTGYTIPVAPIDKSDAFIAALNYIEDKYGNVNDNRVITQTVIWILLGAINVNSANFASANLDAKESAAIRDVITNSAGYIGKGKIVDVVYMICEKSTHTFEFCQPQLVPIYGESNLNNKLVDPGVGSIKVTVDVKKQHEETTVQNFYERTVQNFYERTVQNFYERTVQNFYERTVQNFYERTVQDFYSRDVQNFYERTVQNFYERTVQDFYSRDVQDFYERSVQDFYERSVQNFYERTVQDFYSRDVQDFYERSVQDFYERTVQDFYSRDVQDFYERYMQAFHSRDVQDFYSRDVQDFYERTVQDFYERTVQDFYERTVQDFYERTVQDFYERTV